MTGFVDYPIFFLRVKELCLEKKEGRDMILTIISKLMMCYCNKIRMIFNSISFSLGIRTSKQHNVLICFLRKSILSFIGEMTHQDVMKASSLGEFLRNWSCVSKYSDFTTEERVIVF